MVRTVIVIQVALYRLQLIEYDNAAAAADDDDNDDDELTMQFQVQHV